MKNGVKERLMPFVQKCVAVSCALPAHKKGQHVSFQLFSSSTRTGATYNEALGASTRRDFRFKLCETLKELREARFWLQIAVAAGWNIENIEELLEEGNELVAMLTSACKTLDS